MMFVDFILGSFCGLYMALHAVILVDYLTLAKLKSCLGFTLLCHGLAMSVFFPVAGECVCLRNNERYFTEP